DSTLSGLLSGIGLASIAGLLFAALLGGALVRRGLRPLHEMAREVEAIEAASDLSRRVGPRGDDEVGRLAGQFDRMLARLQEAFESQRRFLADASHELRTPLTVARGQLELMAERFPRPTDARSLRMATEELDRMARIVNDLLLLARLDEGIPLATEPVEVELALRDALLRGMPRGRRCAAVDVQPDLYAQADPERLLQIVTNLVRNAIEHGDAGTELSLAGRARDGCAVITVTDTGPGIPEHELPHVFDRMFRGGRARSAAPAGAGLGLAIAASLVEAMDGAI